MKKSIVVSLLVLCLLLGGVIGYLYHRSMSDAGEPVSVPAEESAQPGETEDPAEQPAEEEVPELPPAQQMDMERLYTSHKPEERVLSVGGQEETWDTYFYFLASQVSYVENFFDTMRNYYGMALGWADVAEGEDKTYADMAVEGVEEALLQFATVESFARENGVSLNQENREAMEQQMRTDMQTVLGADATEEDFTAYLAGLHMSREMYERINGVNQLYQETYRRLYGENGEKMEDAATIQFLRDNGYLSVSHILLMTVDPTTGEALPEEAVAEKLAKAEELAARLQAIQDPAELLLRFGELKEEYCEDSGKAAYPAGYTFTPGTMVPEFEETSQELTEYQVSDPVASSYGYHIILKLPLEPDALLFSSGGSPMSARATAANTEYGQRLQAHMDGLRVEYAQSFETPKLLDYLSQETNG